MSNDKKEKPKSIKIDARAFRTLSYIQQALNEEKEYELNRQQALSEIINFFKKKNILTIEEEKED